jgi:hypothetical protein
MLFVDTLDFEGGSGVVSSVNPSGITKAIESDSDKTGAVMAICSETTGAVIAIFDFCWLLPVMKLKRRLKPQSP